MGWLVIDGHAAVLDTDSRITALSTAITERLRIYFDGLPAYSLRQTPGPLGECWTGMLTGPGFRISNDTRIDRPEAVDESVDSRLYDFLTVQPEIESPEIAFTFGGGEFTPTTSSHIWRAQ